MMDNVQKHNNCINIPMLQSFRSYLNVIPCSCTVLGREIFLGLIGSCSKYIRGSKSRLNLMEVASCSWQKFTDVLQVYLKVSFQFAISAGLQ
jgi:hypothetical protein